MGNGTINTVIERNVIKAINAALEYINIDVVLGGNHLLANSRPCIAATRPVLQCSGNFVGCKEIVF